MPTGPLNRVAENSLAKKVLGWEPAVKFVDGVRRTIDWYVSSRDESQAASALERLSVER
jgi:nucleoside-diphosphate-sugar epimerase